MNVRALIDSAEKEKNKKTSAVESDSVAGKAHEEQGLLRFLVVLFVLLECLWEKWKWK